MIESAALGRPGRDRIFVVYARAAFFNSPDAARAAHEYAAAVREGRSFRPIGGEAQISQIQVQGHATWAQVPPLATGF
jgi:hypothetical protein